MAHAMSKQTDLDLDLEKARKGDGAQEEDCPKELGPKLPPPLAPQEDLHLDHSSKTIFSMYSKLSEEEDKKMAERWQKDAEGILIFAGLFSAAVATLLGVSIQDLRPNSQDTSAFYLANIYQVLAEPNLSQASIPSPDVKPPSFSPPQYAVWVNSLWFLSLIISLTCALLATSLQQWARRYLRVTQPPRCSPEKRARTRAFFNGGVEKMRVPWAVEFLPALLHISLFLFLSGLVVFLRNVNHSVYMSALLCIGLFITVYGCLALMPVLWAESPYYTPLSTPVIWIISILLLIIILSFLVALYGILVVLTFIVLLYILFLRFLGGCIRNCSCTGRPDVGDRGDSDADGNVILRLLSRHCEKISVRLYKQFSAQWLSYISVHIFGPSIKGLVGRLWIEKAIERANTSKIDLGILDWSVVALGEDETLEMFFEAIPGFVSSQMTKDLERYLPDRSKFVKSLGGFLGRTLLSNSLSEEVKTRRLEICKNAVDKTCISQDIYAILHHLSGFRFDRVPQSIQTAQLLASWCTGSEDKVSRGQREIVACILPHVRERDDSWIALARDQFGLQESVLRENIAHGDNSVLLAILLHMIRNRATLGILSLLSRFDILKANHGLQNEFCALWNQLVQQARDSEDWASSLYALQRIRHLYIALHQNTDAAPTQFSASTPEFDPILGFSSSYPLCNIDAHHPNSTISPSTRLEGPNDDSPRPSHLKRQPSPGDTTYSPKAEEPIIIPEPPLSQESPSPSLSPTTNLAQIAPQVTSAAVHNIHDSIQIVSQDLNPLLSVEASGQSLPSSAVLGTNIVRSDKSALDIPINQMGETSQIPAVTSTPFPHPGPLRITAIPSDAPHLPSVSVEQLANNTQQEVAAPYATSGITHISSSSHQIPQSTPNIGAAPQASDERTVVVPTIVSDSGSPPVIIPTPHSGLVPALHSSVGSVPIHPDRVSLPLGSTPSTLTTARSQTTLQISSSLGDRVTTSVGAPVRHDYDEIRDSNALIPMEASLHAHQSGPSTPHVAEDAPPPGDSQHDQS